MEPLFFLYHHQLESVQKFGARLCTKRWSDEYLPLLARLSWPSLSTRRSQQKVTQCCRIFRGETSLHSSRFTPNLKLKPNPLHYHHDKPLLIPFAKTLSYQSSFFVNVVPLWNSLPCSAVSASSLLSFKAHVRDCFNYN